MPDSDSISGVVVTPLKIIETNGGAVLCGLKTDDPVFTDFGEAYFSEISHGQIRAWKRHREMTLNLIVVAGAIRFVLHDDRDNSSTSPRRMELVLSRDSNYARLTVPPLVWLGFQGVGKSLNLLANVANLPHSDDELERRPVKHIAFSW